MLPHSLEEFVPEGHLARLVSKVINDLDTSPIEDKYSKRGQKTYHPKIMLKLLFYGYAIGIRSGRKIAQACETDTAFMYLAQMHHPDFRTINDFRKNHAPEIGDLFASILAVARELGLAKVGTIAVDSSKIRANASVKRSKDRAGYERMLADLKARVDEILAEAEATDAGEDELYGEKRGDELPAELKRKECLAARIEEVMAGMGPEAKVNLTDPDAIFMRLNEGKVKPAYNCQAAVSEDHLIVAAEVVTDANDCQQLENMVERTEANLGRETREEKKMVGRVLADSGYASYDNYEYLDRKEIDAYIPDRYFEQAKRIAAEQAEMRYHKENFNFLAEENCYICPEGKPLPFVGECVYNGKVKRRQFLYRGTECSTCTVKSACTKQRARCIRREMREHLQEEMRAKLSSEEGKDIYRQRMHLAEIPFGHLKHNLGFRHFLLRGREKVGAEFKLMCAAYNLKKILIVLSETQKMGMSPATV